VTGRYESYRDLLRAKGGVCSRNERDETPLFTRCFDHFWLEMPVDNGVFGQRAATQRHQYRRAFLSGLGLRTPSIMGFDGQTAGFKHSVQLNFRATNDGRDLCALEQQLAMRRFSFQRLRYKTDSVAALALNAHTSSFAQLQRCFRYRCWADEPCPIYGLHNRSSEQCIWAKLYAP
jgi:hypothetical protein